MRIHSRESIAFSTNRSQFNGRLIESSLQKLGSGLKIARASDNAAGLAISETMRGQIRGLSQAQSNMQDGLSLLNSADEGLMNTNGLLGRVRELAVMTANGTLTDNDRKTTQTELTQLFSAIDDVAKQLEFNTKKILSEDTSLILQVGANPGQQITIDLFDISTIALGLDGSNLTTREAAEELISKIDEAANLVGEYLTKVGSYTEAIEHHLLNAMVFEGNLTKSFSDMVDTNVATEMMNFISLDIRQKGDHLLISNVNDNFKSMLSLFSK